MNTHFVSKRLAHQIGFVSLVPFAALTLACWLSDTGWLGVFIRGELAYGILTLSFLGGIHWGATLVSNELTSGQTKKVLAWSAVPPLLGWAATMTGGFGFAVLIAGFALAYQVDKRLFGWYRMPEWFIRLRFILTCAVTVSLALTVIAANVRG